MSVSLAFAPSHAHSPVPFSAVPWAMPALPEVRDGFELSGVLLNVAPDRQLYAEGDETRCFYKVQAGVVRTCRFLNDGRRQIDAFHMQGDVFGLEAGAEHLLSAEAVSACTVIAYRRRGLEAMVAQDDRLGRWFFAHAMTCLALAREHSLLLGRASATQKIAAFLQEIADREGSDTIVDLAMARQDIADYLGLTIETVSRTISHLERDGMIKLLTARRILLKDRRALRDLGA